MSEAKHTPGPWQISTPHGRMGGRDFLLQGADSRTVFDTLAADAWPLSAADARLIAAAPELLAACKHLERYVRTGEAGPEGYVVIFPVKDNALALLRAAIAKAEGTD